MCGRLLRTRKERAARNDGLWAGEWPGYLKEGICKPIFMGVLLMGLIMRSFGGGRRKKVRQGRTNELKFYDFSL
jgi:hypothetical protein